MKQIAASLVPVLQRSPARTGLLVDDGISSRRTRLRVLVVMPDSETRASITEFIDPRAIQVETITSGASAHALARVYPFNLIVIDQHLLDMSGTDLVSMLLKDKTTANIPFILVSGSDTPKIAQAVILLSVAGVTGELRAHHGLMARRRGRDYQPGSVAATPWSQLRPRSAAERWAVLVLKTCESDGDLRTLDSWAAFVGVSYSSLCECCRMVEVSPQDARDFARLLNAVMKAVARRCHPSVLLDVSDRRTLRNLLEKAGLWMHEGPLSVDRFVRCQRFIAGDNEGLNVLRTLLAGR